MAVLSITVPDAQLPRVRDAFAATYGYQATVPDPQNPTGPPIPNPESKSQFVLRKMREHVIEVVKAAEAGPAVEAARTAKMADVDNTVILS